MPDQLSSAQGQTLLELARSTLIRKLDPKQGSVSPDLEKRLQDPAFDAHKGTFVTLHLHGALRGCIGSLVSNEPLRDNVAQNAVNAAFQDPRFPPLTVDELSQVDIEVSVLTEPAPLEYSSAQDLLDKLRPGQDGVILKQGMAQSTFLPQVWEQLPQPRDFLSHLSQKAGLPPTAWESGQVQVLTYQVQSFAEKE